MTVGRTDKLIYQLCKMIKERFDEIYKSLMASVRCLVELV